MLAHHITALLLSALCVSVAVSQKSKSSAAQQVVKHPASVEAIDSKKPPQQHDNNPVVPAGYGDVTQEQETSTDKADFEQGQPAKYPMKAENEEIYAHQNDVRGCNDNKLAECTKCKQPGFLQMNEEYAYNYCRKSCQLCNKKVSSFHKFWRIRAGSPFRPAWWLNEVEFYMNKKKQFSLSSDPHKSFSSPGRDGYSVSACFDKRKDTYFLHDKWGKHEGKNQTVGYEFPIPVNIMAIRIIGNKSREADGPDKVHVEAASSIDGPWVEKWWFQTQKDKHDNVYALQECSVLWFKFEDPAGGESLCIRLLGKLLSQDAAQRECEIENGDLASIDSKEEYKFINSTMGLFSDTWLGFETKGDTKELVKTSNGKALSAFAKQKVGAVPLLGDGNCVTMDEEGTIERSPCGEGRDKTTAYPLCKKKLVGTLEPEVAEEPYLPGLPPVIFKGPNYMEPFENVDNLDSGNPWAEKLDEDDVEEPSYDELMKTMALRHINELGLSISDQVDPEVVNYQFLESLIDIVKTEDQILVSAQENTDDNPNKSPASNDSQLTPVPSKGGADEKKGEGSTSKKPSELKHPGEEAPKENMEENKQQGYSSDTMQADALKLAKKKDKKKEEEKDEPEKPIEKPQGAIKTRKVPAEAEAEEAKEEEVEEGSTGAMESSPTTSNDKKEPLADETSPPQQEEYPINGEEARGTSPGANATQQLSASKQSRMASSSHPFVEVTSYDDGVEEENSGEEAEEEEKSDENMKEETEEEEHVPGSKRSDSILPQLPQNVSQLSANASVNQTTSFTDLKDATKDMKSSELDNLARELEAVEEEKEDQDEDEEDDKEPQDAVEQAKSANGTIDISSIKKPKKSAAKKQKAKESMTKFNNADNAVLNEEDEEEDEDNDEANIESANIEGISKITRPKLTKPKKSKPKYGEKTIAEVVPADKNSPKRKEEDDEEEDDYEVNLKLRDEKAKDVDEELIQAADAADKTVREEPVGKDETAAEENEDAEETWKSNVVSPKKKEKTESLKELSDQLDEVEQEEPEEEEDEEEEEVDPEEEEEEDEERDDDDEEPEDMEEDNEEENEVDADGEPLHEDKLKQTALPSDEESVSTKEKEDEAEKEDEDKRGYFRMIYDNFRNIM